VWGGKKKKKQNNTTKKKKTKKTKQKQKKNKNNNKKKTQPKSPKEKITSPSTRETRARFRTEYRSFGAFVTSVRAGALMTPFHDGT